MKESSDIKYINAPVERVYNTLANLENLRPVLDRVLNDESLRDKLREAGHEASLESMKDLELTNDSIGIPAPMVGTVKLRIIEREEGKCIKFETEQSPIGAKLWIQTLPVDENSSKMKLTVDADIPFMLKAMVGSKLKDGIDKVADTLAMINY